MRRTLACATAAVALLAAAPALAETHTVQMLTQGPDGGRYVYSPAFLQVEPGDTIKFVNGDPGHNAATIEGAVPAGGATFNGRINEEIEVTLTEAGLYAYKCTPHYTLGMVGLILVGDEAPNMDAIAAQRFPGRAGRVMDDLMAEARTALE
jgi:pseudoazurin